MTDDLLQSFKARYPFPLDRFQQDAIAAIIDPKLLAGGVDTFAITLEPAGGGTEPRGDLVFAGKV